MINVILLYLWVTCLKISHKSILIPLTIEDCSLADRGRKISKVPREEFHLLKDFPTAKPISKRRCCLRNLLAYAFEALVCITTVGSSTDAMTAMLTLNQTPVIYRKHSNLGWKRTAVLPLPKISCGHKSGSRRIYCDSQRHLQFDIETARYNIHFFFFFYFFWFVVVDEN